MDCIDKYLKKLYNSLVKRRVLSDANSCHFYAASRRNGGFHQRNDECAGGFICHVCYFAPA